MEGFFESILYLVIAVVILILSMKGNKKKGGSQADNREEPFGEPAYEPVLQDENDDYKKSGDVVNTPGTTQEKESTPWISEKDARASVINVESVLKEAETNPIAEQEALLESVDDNYNKKKTKKPPIDFDLKKAVVFSSILERREY